jgi:hypothetical protein
VRDRSSPNDLLRVLLEFRKKQLKQSVTHENSSNGDSEEWISSKHTSTAATSKDNLPIFPSSLVYVSTCAKYSLIYLSIYLSIFS